MSYPCECVDNYPGRVEHVLYDFFFVRT